MFSIFVIMSKQKNIEKLLFKTFDEDIKGADIYNNDGSMWIIFTEKRKWIVEFTKAGTLWYNYRHFTDTLIYFGMELDEGSKYIKKWYEERFLFKPKIVEDSIKERLFFVEDTIDNGVKRTDYFGEHEDYEIEDIIENGVKETTGNINNREGSVENTIQNGVKNSQSFDGKSLKLVEDVIQNGIKDTKSMCGKRGGRVGNTIENGVKHIDYSILGSLYQKDHNVTTLDFTSKLENTIQNGVKHCEDGDWLDGDERFEDIIENGVKLKN
jgi:hypothetical protein